MTAASASTHSGRKIFLSADHGLAVVYFLQSEVVPSLLESGIEVVLLTDEGIAARLEERFGRPGLTVEGLRLAQARRYAETVDRDRQWWLQTLRRVGSSGRINTQAMDCYVDQIAAEEPNRRRVLMPLVWLTVAALRRSRRARRALIDLQQRYNPGLYADLFQRYQPGLVVCSTPGWRLDRYLLREARERQVPTAAVVVGWDNPSSYSLPGAHVDRITCWSDIQRQELELGSDWEASRVHVGGIPTYDGYIRGTWKLSRDEYFRLHDLDPQRKLLSYACSFVSFSPNYQNVEALARLVASQSLSMPSQLLVRLHPNHFMDVHLYAEERRRIHALARETPHMRVVEPVPLGGELGYYSGEDMPEKASMLAHSDVFLTVFSTMVVEAAVHDRPIVSLCLDAPGGWNTPRKYSLALSRIGDWPTHSRFRHAAAGRVAVNERQLREAVEAYLKEPQRDGEARRKFIQDEVTYVDGSAGQRTAAFLRQALEHAIQPEASSARPGGQGRAA